MVVLTVTFVCYLASYRQTILFLIIIAFTLFVGIQFFLQSKGVPIAVIGFSKLLLLLPFGLGALMGFVIMPKITQKRIEHWFTHYINIAVLINIFVMLFTPDGGTYRGIVSRILCIILLIWLVQEMAKVQFQTTEFDRNFFIFNSSPLPWIVCHAVYRMALLSLPTFASSHFLLLEPLTLFVMGILYHLHKKRQKLSFYFGFADTIVVTTLAVVHWFPIPSPFATNGSYKSILQETQWDLIFIPIQLIVFGYGLWAIGKNVFQPKHLG